MPNVRHIAERILRSNAIPPLQRQQLAQAVLDSPEAGDLTFGQRTSLQMVASLTPSDGCAEEPGHRGDSTASGSAFVGLADLEEAEDLARAGDGADVAAADADPSEQACASWLARRVRCPDCAGSVYVAHVGDCWIAQTDHSPGCPVAPQEDD